MRILAAELAKENFCLENIKSIASGIHQMLGQNSEIIIHDLKQPESSVIFVAGELTERDIGAPVTDLVLRTIKNNDDPDDIINYQTKTRDGRIFKSSTFFIKNKEQEVEYCLCINYDISDLLMAKSTISNFIGVENNNEEEKKEEAENFAKNVDEVLVNLIENARDQVDKPVKYMDKDDKLEIIKYLDQRGAFTITKSVETVAEELNVSKYTIYNYLKEIK
ncbi:MAG: helix-turn-helix transcriptional regulator, partial [Halanaerobium sp.]